MTKPWKIALFAGLAERFGARTLQVDWPEAELTAGQLKKRLAEAYPEQAEVIAPAFVACNQAYAHDDAVVNRGDELALLPPVSGGGGDERAEAASAAPRYAVVDGPIDVNAVSELAAHPDHGALIAFVGMTREWTGGKRTVTLEYEAYVPMAEASMRRIGEEIADRWPGTITAIVHRIGEVGIGETSVVIAVSSAHRAEAYEASRYAIERLKQTVPIWKKEVYEDGTEWKGHQLGPWNPLA
ncbi:molybdopterin converting factor [Cohnella sp. CFH 77786]|uniref:molybdenum cofactor biosynthesis protein n=1 Tax=Cohnella sp. CFH 77786 TaxID=2662265 RepID=UPI001C60F172|nr:molybdenum cofactor biosynthesis protein MoaE [Cohnella sp. CFH 77786]MBW5447785.1 molybdopterin converting factor [Cohnella sp. CFH 77786]